MKLTFRQWLTHFRRFVLFVLLSPFLLLWFMIDFSEVKRCAVEVGGDPPPVEATSWGMWFLKYVVRPVVIFVGLPLILLAGLYLILVRDKKTNDDIIW